MKFLRNLTQHTSHQAPFCIPLTELKITPIRKLRYLYTISKNDVISSVRLRLGLRLASSGVAGGRSAPGGSPKVKIFFFFLENTNYRRKKSDPKEVKTYFFTYLLSLNTVDTAPGSTSPSYATG